MPIIMKKVLATLFAVALVLNANAQEVSATYDPDVNGDNNIGVTDLLALLSLFSENDLDDDGIWDSQDDCIGAYDECDVCNGPGPQILGIDTIIVYYDSLYAEAIDEWWVFEVESDTLLTFLCENPGCMDPTADNYDPYAVEQDGSCVYSNGSPVCDFQTAIHFDGHFYELVEIGDQCWFAENLRTEHYTNGDSIPTNLTYSEWESTTDGAMIVYGEGAAGCESFSPDGMACDPAWSLNEYGRMYNWYAVEDARGLCPTGWHVPTDGEWTVMTGFLGDESVVGHEMKTAFGWSDGGNGTDSSGFSGLPGGFYGGYFYNAGREGYWWSSTSAGSYSYGSYAWHRNLRFNTSIIHRSSGYYRRYGMSVRCVKDAD